MKNKLKFLITVVILFLSITGCTYTEAPVNVRLVETTNQSDVSLTTETGDIPEYSGNAYIEINNNIPYFNEVDMSTTSFESYSDLDWLGRCGVAYANLSIDTMPTEERGNIGMIKPSGWQISKYDFVDGKYLYNRCHLIGFQLSGENANEKNLITGTRYLNVTGMLPFENETADYIKSTRNHVLYRVTPIFEGNNLVADGVEMEAYSVEDNGAGICFNVFCYNVEPGVVIDYATGNNFLDDSSQLSDTETGTTNDTSEKEITYIINKNSKVFHLPTCDSVNDMNPNNKKDYFGSREELIAENYKPCGRCKP